MKNKNTQISILKGIGIISVVLGHTCYFSVSFVYMYHLAIFFFVSGFLYNEEKYGKNVTSLFAARMHSIMPSYLLYSILHLLLHNLFVNVGLYGEAYNTLTAIDMLQNFVGTTFFAYAELIGSSFWFLPVLITANAIWGTIVVLSNQFVKPLKNVIRVLLVLFVGFSGVLLIENNIIVAFHLENALLMVPIFALGQIYKIYKKRADRSNNWPLALMALITLIVLPVVYKTHIELSIDRIINPFVFYLSSICGIVFWTFISMKLQKYHFISRILAVCGDYSLDIMALHLLFTKLIDWVYLDFINPEAGEKATFVYSVKELWPIYLLVSIIGSILWRKSINYLWLHFSDYLRSKKIIVSAKFK